MINWLHSCIHNPYRGWDPISESYAQRYAETHLPDRSVITRFVQEVGGIEGKRVIDVGCGPGYYSLEFAEQGADVTCFDISKRYLSMAERRLSSRGYSPQIVLGYLDHIARLTKGGFDAVFVNICWNYCMNDLSFARALLSTLAPRGIIFVRETTEAFDRNKHWRRRMQYWLNRNLYWKIGHPFPPRGRIEKAFERLGGCSVRADYSDPVTDVVTVRRLASGSSLTEV